ncbi:MAG: TIGR03986 family CRISPR-associated RAMP protein [Rivularia sp. T60_A2020_040]|nr:TIGR03986 family CRISPR-associated RAMP protein [Rivularia sp. T60_A2020_040]
MNPRHIKQITDSKRIAKAPYNFVELPTKIVEVKPESLPQQNIYYSKSENRYTGKIECTLTTKSPLYIRCGLTKLEFECGAESKDLPDFFYTQPEFKDSKPVIPGSSLRGMLRSLIEIISFSKINPVSEKEKFFFRAVAADKDDPLTNIYKKLLNKKNVKAGYLVEKNNNWYIRPAKNIEDKPFISINEKDIEDNIDDFTFMRSLNYAPQYKHNISFGDLYTKNGRRCAKSISGDCATFDYVGVLVTSGNMLENTNLDNEQERQKKLNTKEGRKYHYLVREPDANSTLIKINEDAIKNYCSALTSFQKAKSPYENNPFDEKNGILKNKRVIVIFYSQLESEEITLFGQSPNFRIPYIPKSKQTAASAVDFIPKNLRDTSVIDIADAIFGFVRHKDDKNTSTDTDDRTLKSLAGRIFIENAICHKTINDDIWLTGNFDQTITPKILSNPKPTTFQHYLVQTNAEKKQLKHYASEPPQENEVGKTVIRGHKLYWHKGKNPDIEHPDGDKAEGTQITQIKPIKTGVSFKFNIHFENLNNIELGAILWILKIAAQPKYCLSLGMGKPLGMGAIKIEHELLLKNLQNRYSQLFSNNQWLTGEENQSDTNSISTSCIDAFEKYIVDNIHEDDYPEEGKPNKLDEIPRIQMLLLMLCCENLPSANDTLYMTIEPKNEYKERPVLPTPFQVMGEEDNRKFPTPVISSDDSSQDSLEKPKLKRNNNRYSRPNNYQNNPNPAMQRPKPPKK